MQRQILPKKILFFLLFLSPIYTFSQCATTINTFPYNEDFELNMGGWSSGGINNDWAWGQPTKATISSAGSGSKCWITGGLSSSFYSFGQRSYVESPCFDFSSLSYPYIEMLIFLGNRKYLRWSLFSIFY
ncbi:MAG: hypothetical protein R2831_00975 [Chitinophagaceae bacterium]